MALTAADREALLDRVLDLQHDLGKYLRLPLRMLPKNASDADVHAALHEALLTTRRDAKGAVRGARAMWDEFASAASSSSGDLAKSAAFTALRAAVERALTWESALADPKKTISRAAVDDDFAAVQAALAALRDELETDG